MYDRYDQFSDEEDSQHVNRSVLPPDGSEGINPIPVESSSVLVSHTCVNDVTKSSENEFVYHVGNEEDGGSDGAIDSVEIFYDNGLDDNGWSPGHVCPDPDIIDVVVVSSDDDVA